MCACIYMYYLYIHIYILNVNIKYTYEKLYTYLLFVYILCLYKCVYICMYFIYIFCNFILHLFIYFCNSIFFLFDVTGSPNAFHGPCNSIKLDMAFVYLLCKPHTTLLTFLILPFLLYHVFAVAENSISRWAASESRREGFVNFSSPLPFPCYISAFNVKLVSRDTKTRCVWVITE